MAYPGEPRLRLKVQGLIALLGLAVVATAMSAEGTRAKSYSYIMDRQQILHCRYTHSAASSMALTAVCFLILCMTTTHLYAGFLFCSEKIRYQVGRVGLISNIAIASMWVLFGASCSLLIWGANADRHRADGTSGGYTPLTCTVAKPGIFASGGVLALLCFIAAEVYYTSGMKARWELWRIAQAYSSTSLESDIAWHQTGESLPPVMEEMSSKLSKISVS